MTRPLKFHQTLNQPPKGAHHHGKHRRPGKKAHRNPADRAGDGARGTITWQTLGPAFWAGGTANADQDSGEGAGLSEQLIISSFLGSMSWWVFADSKPLPTIVTTGELTGYRAWWLIEGDLYSIAHEQRWEPGVVMEGDVDGFVGAGPGRGIEGGVYCYKRSLSNDAMAREYVTYLNNKPFLQHTLERYHQFLLRADAIVTGTVKLWGQVVEHDIGYRSQFARIVSLDAIHVPSYPEEPAQSWLEQLRRKYGV